VELLGRFLENWSFLHNFERTGASCTISSKLELLPGFEVNWSLWHDFLARFGVTGSFLCTWSALVLLPWRWVLEIRRFCCFPALLPLSMSFRGCQAHLLPPEYCNSWWRFPLRLACPQGRFMAEEAPCDFSSRIEVRGCSTSEHRWYDDRGVSGAIAPRLVAPPD